MWVALSCTTHHAYQANLVLDVVSSLSSPSTCRCCWGFVV